MQVCEGQSAAAIINLLDPELFPYTQVNNSTFPGPDDELKSSTPRVGTPEYASILNFVRREAPDEFNDKPVRFGTMFFQTGELDTWGAPISRPMVDPNNGNFVYRRFQRGIMHYAVGEGTHGLLLADYFKAIILGPERAGSGLPSDLAGQAASSVFFRQYCPGEERWLCRPGDLSATDLTGAFEPGTDPISVGDQLAPTFTPVSTSTATPPVEGTATHTPAPVETPTPTPSPMVAPTHTQAATPLPSATPTPPAIEVPTPAPTATPTPTSPVVSVPTVPPSPTVVSPIATPTLPIIKFPPVLVRTPTPTAPTAATPQPKAVSFGQFRENIS